MKSIFKIALLASLPVALMATAQDLHAQKKKKEKEEKVEKEIRIERTIRDDDQRDKQMIIVTTRPGEAGKTVIEVENGEVKVNGKPMDDAEGGDVEVQVVKIPNEHSFQWMGEAPGAPMPPIALNGQNFQFFSDDSNRAMLGVVTESAENGVEVTQVQEESAAEAAGLEEGDIIQAVDETKIESPDQLAETIRKHKPGDKVTVKYLRGTDKMSASAELKQLKNHFMITGADNGPGFSPRMQGMAAPRFRVERDFNGNFNQGFDWMSDRPRLGISVQDTEDGNGVKIIEADEDEIAAKAGLKENDIITQINDSKISSADAVAEIVRETMRMNKPMDFEILRNGKKQTITVKVPKKLKTADL